MSKTTTKIIILSFLIMPLLGCIKLYTQERKIEWEKINVHPYKHSCRTDTKVNKDDDMTSQLIECIGTSSRRQTTGRETIYIHPHEHLGGTYIEVSKNGKKSAYVIRKTKYGTTRVIKVR